MDNIACCELLACLMLFLLLFNLLGLIHIDLKPGNIVRSDNHDQLKPGEDGSVGVLPGQTMYMVGDLSSMLHVGEQNRLVATTETYTAPEGYDEPGGSTMRPGTGPKYGPLSDIFSVSRARHHGAVRSAA